MIKGITFDFWNTLMQLGDQNLVFRERTLRVKRALETEGYFIDQETIYQEVYAVWKIVFNRQYNYGLDFTPEEQVRELLLRLNVNNVNNDCFLALFKAYTEQVLDNPPLLVEGVSEVLEELNLNNYKIGLICNTGATPGIILRKVLEYYQLDHFFEIKTFSNEEGIAKPNPQIFSLTLKKLGVTPGQAVHIGDDPITDIDGARAANMKSIWFNNKDIQPIPQYTWRVESLREVPLLLSANRGY